MKPSGEFGVRAVERHDFDGVAADQLDQTVETRFLPEIPSIDFREIDRRHESRFVGEQSHYRLSTGLAERDGEQSR